MLRFNFSRVIETGQDRDLNLLFGDRTTKILVVIVIMIVLSVEDVSEEVIVQMKEEDIMATLEEVITVAGVTDIQERLMNTQKDVDIAITEGMVATAIMFVKELVMVVLEIAGQDL